MKIYKLDKSLLKPFLLRLLELGTLWGPVKKEESYVFKEVTDPEHIDLSYHRTLIPIKKLFFPPKQDMMSYNFNKGNGDSLQEINTETDLKVIFGLHPCEINGLNIQDEFFLEGKYSDPYYENLRKNTIIIGHSCLPDQNCVCNNTGTSDVSKGFDLFLNELSEKYLVWVGSATGDDLILDNIDLFEDEVDETDLSEFNQWNRRRNLMFHHKFDAAIMPKLMELSYENEFWEKLGEECLSCGACTAVCPTCSCYNVFDRLKVGEKGIGTRERDWDSCQYPEFSVVAGNVDFRPTQGSRLKLYYTHKLDSYKGEINYPSCVGCGRCVEYCPVNINIIRVTQLLTEMKL